VHNFNIWGDADVLDLPSPIEIEEGHARGSDSAAVNQEGVSANPDKAAPGPRAHERTHCGLAEVPRQSVAAGAGEFVDDHRLWSEDGGPRGVLHHALAGDDAAAQRPV